MEVGDTLNWVIFDENDLVNEAYRLRGKRDAYGLIRVDLIPDDPYHDNDLAKILTKAGDAGGLLEDRGEVMEVGDTLNWVIIRDDQVFNEVFADVETSSELTPDDVSNFIASFLEAAC